MVETERHKQLKLLGRTILRHRGFDNSEIFEEYKTEIGNKSFVVDICGIEREDYPIISPSIENKIKRAIAVECGSTNPEKLINLKLFFNEVIHLPYGITSIKSDLRKLIDEQTDIIKDLQNENIALQNKIRTLESRIDRFRYDSAIRDRIDILISALYKISDLRYYTSSKTSDAIDDVIYLMEKLYPMPQDEINRNGT